MSKPTAAQLAALKAAAPSGLRFGGAGGHPVGVDGAQPARWGTLVACITRGWLVAHHDRHVRWTITDAGRSIIAEVAT